MQDPKEKEGTEETVTQPEENQEQSTEQDSEGTEQTEEKAG